MADEVSKFAREVEENIAALGRDAELQAKSLDWIVSANRHRYSYNFRWLGRPIIQYPQDILAMQEIVWAYRPDLIIETGVAHGGSLILWSSLMELIDEQGKVIGIDIDIRAHNRAAIEAHPLAKRITLIEGSSVSDAVLEQVRARAVASARPLVFLDSNHTHEHVLAELRLYSPFVRAGGHLIVLDTIIEDFPEGAFPDRPWGKGNNPKTAVHAFLEENDRFNVDRSLDHKLQISVAPEGYLRCLRDP